MVATKVVSYIHHPLILFHSLIIEFPCSWTASHLPFNRNGFKFFTNAGGLGKADIKDILERAAEVYNQFTEESLMNTEGKASKSIKKVDYMAVYASDLVKAVHKAAGNIGMNFLWYSVKVSTFRRYIFILINSQIKWR